MAAPAFVEPSVLKSVSLFSDLDDQACDTICKMMKLRVVPAGTTIVNRGEVAAEMFFILSGKVKVVDNSKELNVATSGCFGELALVYDMKRTASVVAVEETSLAVLDKNSFAVLRQQFPQIGSRIKQIAEERFENFKNTLRTTDVGDATTFTEEQINQFRAIFQDIDADGSGQLDIDELGELLERLMGKKPSTGELQAFLAKIDADGNGTIDFDEFLNGLRYLAWLVTPTPTTATSTQAKKSGKCPFFILMTMTAVTSLVVAATFAARRYKRRLI